MGSRRLHAPAEARRRLEGDLASPGRPVELSAGGAQPVQAYVHHDAASARAARSLGARAFTTGNNIYFGSGQYDDRSPSGQSLLRHEMTHVLAQSGRPTSAGAAPSTMSSHHGSDEVAARHAGAGPGGVQVQPATGAAPSFTTDLVQRTPLPFTSSVEIHHNLLEGQSDFHLEAGEGIVVEIAPGWYADGEQLSDEDTEPIDHRGPDRPPGLVDELRVTLETPGFFSDSGKGRCSASIGTWNRMVLKTDESGSHRLEFEVNDHNHNFWVGGPVSVRKAETEELAEACGMPEGMSGSEALHYALAIAGMAPVIGIAADAADSALYVMEGDWVQAGISAAAMVPVIGDGAALVRLGGRTAVTVTRTAARGLDARTVGRALKETRSALRRLRVPPALKHPRNALGIDADRRLIELARDVRVSQAGITREAFSSYNVATARVRVGTRIEYLEAGNAPGALMHSEDFLLSQVDVLRRDNPGTTVVIEQLFSERIPCTECLSKLQRLTNAELFYSVSEYGRRAADLMRAYGL